MRPQKREYDDLKVKIVTQKLLKYLEFILVHERKMKHLILDYTNDERKKGTKRSVQLEKGTSSRRHFKVHSPVLNNLD